FACTPEDCGGIKVDFFSLTGSVRALSRGGGPQHFTLDLEPKNSQTAQAVASSGAQVRLLVRSATDAATSEDLRQERDVKKKEALDTSERYLEEHKVLSFLQQIMQGLIKERPADPYGFVAKQFAQRSEDTAAPAAPPLPPPPDRMKDEAAIPVDLGELKASLAGEKPEEDETEMLRKQAREALLKGAESGELSKVLEKSKSQQQEAVPEDAESDLSRSLERQATMLELKEDETEKHRKQAREALLKGAESGELSKVLEKSKSLQQAQPDEDETEKLRKQAREALLKGAESGELSKVLEKSKSQQEAVPEEDETEQLRIQARDALLESAQSGMLADLLLESSQAEESPSQQQVQPEEDETEKLRKQAREALLRGAESGELSKVLEKSRSTEVPLELEVAGAAHPETDQVYEESPLSNDVKMRSGRLEVTRLAKEKVELLSEVEQ
ncbi:unnamed protein product, partial [Polarella glacialis]